MNTRDLIATARAMMADGKGLLAMDESTGTCNKRFAGTGIPQTEEARRAYRELLVTTLGLGECIEAASGEHTGCTELKLTAYGEDEARGLTQRLRQIGFTRVLVNPRLRARQTCELAGFAPASEIEPDLAEWDYGDYEGRRSVDIRKEYPHWNVWRDGCPHGETPAEVSARTDRVIAKLCTRPMATLRSFRITSSAPHAVRWIGLPLIEGQHFALHPASVSILGYEPLHPDRRLIELWNETAASRGGG